MFEEINAHHKQIIDAITLLYDEEITTREEFKDKIEYALTKYSNKVSRVLENA